MIQSIYKGFISETQKVKDTFTFWFTILGSLLIPFIFFLIYLFRVQNFIPPEDINPWTVFINSNLQAISFLLFPLHIILIIAININIEHHENSWKKLFVLPVSRESIYISKLLFLLLQILISLLIFAAALFVFGCILGLLHSELNFLKFRPEFTAFSKLIARLFISILGIFSIQYVISLFFKNIIIPISFGVFLTIIASILVQGWSHSIYFPYAFPMWFFLNSNQGLVMDTFYGLTVSEITSCSLFILVNSFGVLLFKSMRLK